MPRGVKGKRCDNCKDVNRSDHPKYCVRCRNYWGGGFFD